MYLTKDVKWGSVQQCRNILLVWEQRVSESVFNMLLLSL